MAIDVAPEVLSWARERARLEPGALEKKFPALADWENGTATPTFAQLQRFAKATHAPFGYLLLPRPPEEAVPIPDLRTFGDAVVRRPSADLLDQIYLVQQRQEWYRDHRLGLGSPAWEFVGSVTTADDVVTTATVLRDVLGFSLDVRSRYTSWTEALRDLIDLVEDSGVLVMISGVVGSNTRRPLDPREFRGFALADRMAPVVFVNGKDTKAAQIFTLVHELVHIWLGESALSDASLVDRAENRDERFCNDVAAEVLVPLAALRADWDPGADRRGELDRLAARFRVSTLVVLRRVFDLGGFSWREYREWYARELSYVLEKLGERKSTGGDFYDAAPFQMSRRFARAVVSDTYEGRTLHRDAFRLLGFSSSATLVELGRRLGVG